MDQNSTYINDDLLVKYLLGETNTVEQQEVERWANADPGHFRKLEDFRKILDASRHQPDNEIDETEALERLNARIERAPKNPSFNPAFILRWAAIFAVVIGTGWFLYSNTLGSNINIGTLGNTLTQHLPDGSTAILNKHSTLSFAGGFFSKTRQVKLKGEAFFQVSPDKNKPFIIDVNNVKVTVVGTAFNVKSDGQKTTVIVENGIVKVGNQRESIRLTAGEKVEVKNNRFLKGESQGKLYNYYYSNELVCDRTPLNELIAVLNEKFAANILIVNPAIRTLPISTTFKNDSLKDILTVVSETFNIKVEYGQGIIKLK